MADLSWLSNQAIQIHDVFMGLFYPFLGLLLVVGVMCEYFKLPMGGVPTFQQLVGRALVAAFILNAYPEIMNAISSIADSLASRLGDLNEIKVMLAASGKKAKELSFSWVSIKDSITYLISFASFFIVYASVYVCNAMIIYTWVLLFIFSPILIALFILPATAGATSALFRALIEVASWKVVWAVLATLLWSNGVNDINQPATDVNFFSVICLNLMLAFSVILVPKVVHGLTSGLTSVAASTGAMAGAFMITAPAKIGKIVAAIKTGGAIGLAQGMKLLYDEGTQVGRNITPTRGPPRPVTSDKPPAPTTPSAPSTPRPTYH